MPLVSGRFQITMDICIYFLIETDSGKRRGIAGRKTSTHSAKTQGEQQKRKKEITITCVCKQVCIHTVDALSLFKFKAL